MLFKNIKIFGHHVNFTGCRKRLAGTFINLAGISLTSKNRSDIVQYEKLLCNMTINHKK
jgi:hypothetical protein